MFIYLSIKHVSYFFLVAVSFSASLRFIMVWWFWTYPCAVLMLLCLHTNHLFFLASTGFIAVVPQGAFFAK